MEDFGLSDNAIEWIALWKEVRYLQTGERIEFGEACRDYFVMMRNRGEKVKFQVYDRKKRRIS